MNENYFKNDETNPTTVKDNKLTTNYTARPLQSRFSPFVLSLFPLKNFQMLSDQMVTVCYLFLYRLYHIRVNEFSFTLPNLLISTQLINQK